LWHRGANQTFAAVRFYLLLLLLMLLSRISVAPRPRLPLAAGLVGALALFTAAPVAAQGLLGSLDDATGLLVQVGWQRGTYTHHGMGNMRYHVLRHERGQQTASVQTHMTWTDTYNGPAIGITRTTRYGAIGLRWSNRHTHGSGAWTTLDGQAWETDFRVRLNEVSFTFGGRLWGGRVQPGMSLDVGLLRIHRRDSKAGAKGDWVPMHSDGGFLSSGGKKPTAGVTAYCDVTLLVTKNLGLSVRPYYQHHIIEADYLGIFGTTDVRTFRYGIHNFGASVSAALYIARGAR
jgi:hypothetical protein